MASTTISESLYVILGVNEDASTQEIKQAYKKAALRTHPDRALPERKVEAETNFKRVAEAYEILSKPESRHRYDMYGTPGSPPPPRSSGRPKQSNFTYQDPSHTFFGTSPDSNPFTFQWESSHDSARRAQAQRGNGFRRPWGMDPFDLFNQMFEQELHNSRSAHSMFDNDARHHQNTFTSAQRPTMTDPFASFGPVNHPFDFMSSVSSGQSSDEDGFRIPIFGSGPSSGVGSFGGSQMSSRMQSMSSSGMQSSGGGGHFVSQSTETRTVNGRTETVIRKTDGQGNEEVVKITPEGRSVTLNGVEQNMLPQGNSGNAGMLPDQRSSGWSRF